MLHHYAHVHEEWPQIVGTCPDGPWIKAAAVADALTMSDAEVIIIVDADVLIDPDHLRRAVGEVAGAAESFKWAVPHRVVRRLAAEATARVQAGSWPSEGMHLDQPVYAGHAGGGIVVVRRETYDACPLDPRFAGWGHEDDAWATALRCLHGRPWRASRAPLWHLWHPAAPRRTRAVGAEESYALYCRYAAATGKPSRMAEIVGDAREALGVLRLAP